MNDGPRSIKITARVDSALYRNAEELVYSRYTPVKTMSDVIRLGFDLAVIYLARQTRDPRFMETADQIEELTLLNSQKAIAERAEEIQQLRWRFGKLIESTSSGSDRTGETVTVGSGSGSTSNEITATFDYYTLEFGPEEFA